MMSYTDWPSENWEYKDRLIRGYKIWIKIYYIFMYFMIGLYTHNMIRLVFERVRITTIILIALDILLVAAYRKFIERDTERIILLEMEKQFNQ